MPRRVQLDTSVHDGVRRYVYSHRWRDVDGGLFERRWRGVADDWTEPGRTAWNEYAVNPTWREDVAVYLGLIWRLSAPLMLYAVPRFHREAGMRAVGEPYALINWEHEIEHERPRDQISTHFAPAASSPGRGREGTPWGQEAKDRAGLFEIVTFGQLRDLLKALWDHGPTSSVNIYAIPGESRARQLAQSLQQPACPTLSECLGRREMLIDLQLSNEYGEADVLAIHSTTGLDPVLHDLLAEYEAAITRYEAEVEDIEGATEFNNRMSALLALHSAGPGSRWTHYERAPRATDHQTNDSKKAGSD